MVLTTTIGAFPKPPYVPISDGFGDPGVDPTGGYLRELELAGDKADALFERATHEVVGEQVEAGIDIPTDGEIRRENFVHYLCRHLDGISFAALAQGLMAGTTPALLPTVVSPISVASTPLPRDYQVAQAATDQPVKITLPGPATLAASVVDYHYRDDVELRSALADAVNVQVRALADAGCRHIQVDEPMLARQPRQALDHGIAQLEACFAGVPDDVTRTTHVCLGYPAGLDLPDPSKAPRQSYLDLARALDRSLVDAVSIEDAHRHNDLGTLLPRFEQTTVILGVVDVGRSWVEPVEKIVGRLKVARAHLPADRLIAAPDCGLGFLGRDLAVTKLRRLCAAARSVR